MTTAEYLRTPESLVLTELIYGQVRVADSPLQRHQAVVLDMSLALVAHVQERRLGQIWISPLDVILDAEHFTGTNVIERASFDKATPLRSRVLPDFDRTLGAMLRWA